MQQPWLENKKWAGNQILSGAKNSSIFFWIFALVWNLCVIPLLLNADDMLQKAKQEPVIYSLVIFPLAGIWLFVLAIKHTRDWLRVGNTPLKLDPFPGSIGCHLGGSIDTNLRYDMNASAEITVQCVYSYISGSGKNRSRRESIKWQNKGACHIGRSAKGAVFSFRFSVPEDLPESDVSKGSSSYHLWRVNLDVLDAKGTGLSSRKSNVNRSFVIPVFKTGQMSAQLHQGTEEHPETIRIAERGLESVADIRSTPTGLEVQYAPFQRPGSHIFTMVFGVFFIASGLFAGSLGAPLIFPIIFSIVGGLITLAGIHGLGKGLLVSVGPERISARRFLFGVPITTTHIDRQSFSSFEIKKGGSMQYGTKTTVFYRLIARSSVGKKLTVAERHTSRPEIELIKKKYEAALK